MSNDCIVEYVDLCDITNKNEKRVRALISDILAEYPDYRPRVTDVEDIYALVLNNLPPRYTQKVYICFREPVTDEMIIDQLHKAIKKVRDNPNS